MWMRYGRISGRGGFGNAPMADLESWEAPASYGQERLWLACQLVPGTAGYQMSATVPLPADIDEVTVTGALAEVVRRHEVLRTALRAQGETVVQVVHAGVPVDLDPLDTLDLTDLDTAEAARRLHATVAQDVRRPIDLSAAPLWRVRLVRARAGATLVFVAHHTIVDGASLALLRAEVRELCDAALAGRPPSLPQLSIQYADYAAWQRGRLDGELYDTQLAYWRDRLDAVPPLHGVPTDWPRPAGAAHPGDELHFTLPFGSARAAAELAGEQGATEAMVLLSAWYALLHRLGGQSDLVVGTLVSGRSTPQLTPLIGMFVNTLPLRVEVDADTPFLDLLERVREVMLDAWDHQDIPVHRIIEAVAPRRDPTVAPVYQLGFNHLGTLGLQRGNGTAVDDLVLDVSEDDARLEYRTDLFSRSTIERIARYYARLLTCALAAPHIPVGALALTDPAEIGAAAAVGHGPVVADPPAGTVADLVAKWAVRTPDAPAVEDADGSTLTYRELLTRADRLARRLCAEGVGPEHPVGVALPRGADLVVALLGVMRAGAAYVPIDPEYPQARRAYLVADSGAALVLTGADLDGADDDRPLPLPDPDRLAYIIYTSGSTGQPKGAMVEHRSLVNYVTWFVREYAVTAADRILVSTSPSFDAFGVELYPTLVAGGTLVMAPQAGLLDPPGLLRHAAQRRVTALSLVPTTLREVTACPELADCVHVRMVLCGGEQLTADALAALWERLPVPVHNMYGPTEATIAVSYHTCRPGDPLPDPVPIGRPLANTRLYVLDVMGAPVPAGVPGQLYAGGVPVGRGYRRRPAATAAAFVPDPFGPPGGRLYATGDLARWSVDGTLAYLGRIDAQVKVHGLRIEPGEIAAALRAQPGVKDAAVVADGTGARLIGYVVGDTDTGALLAALRADLPAHLVPAALITVDALPRTGNGKLDLGALPAPDAEPARPAYRAPATAAEELVVSVWAEVLDRAGIGADDDFFDLGGHSLVAVRVAGRLAAALEIEVPIRLLFTATRAAALAEALEGLLNAQIDTLSDEDVHRMLSEERT
jgi:amino acid adenylation domain-containing protein